MNFNDTYAFDPNAYNQDGAGGLLNRIKSMMQELNAPVNSASRPDGGAEYTSESFAGEPASLLARLRALQRQQAAYVPLPPRGRNALVDHIVAAESGGNPNAANSRSTARGVGQFTEGTWLGMLAKHRPDLTGSREERLALRYDPKLSAEMVEALANDNARVLARAGHETTPGNVYLAHFVGPAPAVAVLNADPTASVRSVVGERAVTANPFLAKMTIGDLRAWADRKMRSKVVQPSRALSPTFPDRANPLFPVQGTPRLGGTPQQGTNDLPRQFGSSSVPQSQKMDFANDEDADARPPLTGLVSGRPMQNWMMPIFGAFR